jgi:hypothetical protein
MDREDKKRVDRGHDRQEDAKRPALALEGRPAVTAGLPVLRSGSTAKGPETAG